MNESSVVMNESHPSEVEPEGHQEKMIAVAEGRDPAVEAPSETPSEEAPKEERPEWLPEKFNSAEDLAKSYAELEAKLAKGETTDTAEGEEGGDPESTQPEFQLDEFSQEFADTGELSEESFTKLEENGFSRETVEQYIEGVRATQELQNMKAYEAAGGKENLESALEWAKSNYSAEEIKAYDDAVTGEDFNQALSAIKGLTARYESSEGRPPQGLLEGNTGSSANNGYESLAQMRADMAKPEYATDPAFRQMVAKKISRSNIM